MNPYNNFQNKNKYNTYEDQYSMMYVHTNFFDEYSNSPQYYDLSNYNQYKGSNGKKARLHQSQYENQYNMSYPHQYQDEQQYSYNNRKNIQKSKIQQHQTSLSFDTQYSLASKMTQPLISKGVKIYIEGQIFINSFHNKDDISPTEELFLQSSSSSSQYSANTNSSSDEDKNSTSSTKYFATYQSLDGPDPCNLDPPAFTFQ